MVGDFELRELQQERKPRARLNRWWYGAAFAAGVLIVMALGFGTSMFHTGPDERDVEAAYRDGVDQGTIEGEEHWAEELERRWWVGYRLGRNEQSSISVELLLAIRDGFSWEAGFEAGKRSSDLDPAEAYSDGWRDGYVAGWGSVTGETGIDAPAPPSERRAEWSREP